MRGKRSDYKTCPDCGDNLDSGEICDCKKHFESAQGVPGNINIARFSRDTIAAVQWTGENLLDIVEFLGGEKPENEDALHCAGCYYVTTSGTVKNLCLLTKSKELSGVTVGDYICKPVVIPGVSLGQIMTKTDFERNFIKF